MSAPDFKSIIAGTIAEAISEVYSGQVDISAVSLENTHPGFEGDFTLVVFPLLRFSRKPPETTAGEIGDYLLSHLDFIETFQVIKGFLNITLKPQAWLEFFMAHATDDSFGYSEYQGDAPVVIEYSSPNTNKPLHLGHIRNNLLGFSLSRILQATGWKVVRVNLVNDRGIHISKSMLAWSLWGEGETPESAGMKGDHLVGKYYVMFEQEQRRQVATLVDQGVDPEEAPQKTSLMQSARDMLRRWEQGEPEVVELWKMMNSWVYKGFDETYRRLGVAFDYTDYESETYLRGKSLVDEGLGKGIFNRREDGSVWADLTAAGMDEKLLLRSDGTSVYITQDLGTAQLRHDRLHPDMLIYVVGNEQIYHFDVLKQLLRMLGRGWADGVHHLSYGMVELPHGRMKSREGTVVDADDLMDEMTRTAQKTAEELGKLKDFSSEELKNLYRMVGLAALKYFILKVDPKKNMLFNPEESIDFDGNTGPFIQYTYARIRSLFRKAGKDDGNFLQDVNPEVIDLLPVEREMLHLIYDFPQTVRAAADALNPALIANHCYDLVKKYNSYYQDNP
ncbi:MAG: arginine--tRNA ligase, partial [Bacteroidales bacterium]|nr:arginine--tRNA ligase [Bacteroidales bacterium]